MVKTNALSKSVWAQMGLGGRGRDIDTASAPIRVSEEAQAKRRNEIASHQLDSSREERRGRLPERPSTSAGPASSSSSIFSKRRNGEKRETKDDLYFNPLAAHGRGTTFYNFPLPGPLPTPNDIPEPTPPPQKSSSPARPPTPESIGTAHSEMNVPRAEIGMALGSPAHPPSSWKGGVQSPVHIPTSRYQAPIDSPARTYQSSSVTRSSTPEREYASAGRGSPPPPIFTKQKSARWKLFGGIFGGKKEKAAFYQLQPELTLQTQTTTVIEANLVPEKKSHGLGRSKSKRSAKNKPDKTKTAAEPTSLLFGFQSPQQEQPANPEIRLVDPSGEHTPDVGLLDIDIPSVHMERYSVMFGTVLQKPSSANSSALLARRQATLEKLKSVNAELASKEEELNARAKLLKPRRATSPQPTKSPAFSLFPSTHSPRTSSPSRNYPSLNLQRSNTSPAALSPSRPSFAPDNEAHKMLISDAKSDSKKSEAKLDRASGAEWPKTRKWEQEKSTLILNSPDSISGAELERLPTISPNTAGQFPMKPKLVEPNWQMVSKPGNTANSPFAHIPNSSISGSTTSDSNHSTSTSSSGASAPNSSSPRTTAHFSKLSHIGLQKVTTHNTRIKTASPDRIEAPRTRSRTETNSPEVPPAEPSTPSRARELTSTKVPKLKVEAPRSSSTTRTPTTPRPTLTSRARSATTTVIKSPPLSHHNTHQASKSIASPSPTSKTHERNKQSIVSLEDEDEYEAQLRTLADVSIARQISVSRRQRQLLVFTAKGKKPIVEVVGKKIEGDSPTMGNPAVNTMKVPSPAKSISQVASPLGAVAMATKEEIARSENPMEIRPRKGSLVRNERLVETKAAVTPTLVVVGDEPGERESKDWVGVSGSTSLVERRRGKEIGEITVGIQIEGTQAIGAAKGKEKEGLKVGSKGGHMQRKSESVVVESMGEGSDSNSK